MSLSTFFSIALLVLCLAGCSQSDSEGLSHKQIDFLYDKAKNFKNSQSGSNKRQIDSAVFYYKKVIDLSEKINYPVGVIKGNNGLGLAFKILGDTILTLSHFHKATIPFPGFEASDTEIFKWKSYVYQNLSNFYSDWGQYEVALENAIRAESDFSLFLKGQDKHTIEDTFDLIDLHSLIGLLYRQWGDDKIEFWEIKPSNIIEFDSSTSRYERGLELIKLINPSKQDRWKKDLNESDIYMKLSVNYRRNGDFKTAKTYIDKSINISQQNDQNTLLAEAYVYLSNLLRDSQNLDLALQYSKLSESLLDSSHILQPDIWLNRGLIYERGNQLPEAFKAYLQAEILAKNDRYPQRKKYRLYKNLSRISRSIGNETNSLFYREKYPFPFK